MNPAPGEKRRQPLREKAGIARGVVRREDAAGEARPRMLQGGLERDALGGRFGEAQAAAWPELLGGSGGALSFARLVVRELQEGRVYRVGLKLR